MASADCRLGRWAGAALVGEAVLWEGDRVRGGGTWVPYHSVADPGGRYLFGVGDNFLASYRIGEDGSLALIGWYEDKTLAVGERGGIAVTPGGTQLLVTGTVGMGAPSDLVRRFAVGKTGKLRRLR